MQNFDFSSQETVVTVTDESYDTKLKPVIDTKKYNVKNLSPRKKVMLFTDRKMAYEKEITQLKKEVNDFRDRNQQQTRMIEKLWSENENLQVKICSLINSKDANT